MMAGVALAWNMKLQVHIWVDKEAERPDRKQGRDTDHKDHLHLLTSSSEAPCPEGSPACQSSSTS